MYQLQAREFFIRPIQNQLTQQGVFVDYKLIKFSDVKYKENGEVTMNATLYSILGAEEVEYIANSFGLPQVTIPKSIVDNWKEDDNVLFNAAFEYLPNIEKL